MALYKYVYDYDYDYDLQIVDLSQNVQDNLLSQNPYLCRYFQLLGVFAYSERYNINFLFYLRFKIVILANIYNVKMCRKKCLHCVLQKLQY